MAVSPSGFNPIPPTPCLETNDPKEIKRHDYENPVKKREEFVLIYEENGKLKADTYHKRWNAVISNDIDVFLFQHEGSRNIKDLSLERCLEILNDPGIVGDIHCGPNGNVSFIEFA